jgi:uncharacterized protein YecE (DUF72 family)
MTAGGPRHRQGADMSGRLTVGTSGFSYAHWRDVFYPPKTPQSRWLEYYASVFSAVELNVTFYRLPSAGQFRSWRERVPPSFRFVLKGSRFITHYHRLADPVPQIRKFFSAAAGLADGLECVLWQLPPDMEVDAARLDAFVTALPDRNAGHGRLRHAFEFRNESWFAEPVYEVLHSANASLVLADPSTLGRAEAAGIPSPGDFTYLRFHGTTHDLGGYDDADLSVWFARARTDLEEGRDVYAFFNNDTAGMAPRDALRFAQVLHEDER